MTNINEELLHKIFNYLKENNFFIDEEWKIDADIFKLIENYLISLHLSEYLFLETVDMRLTENRERKRLEDECVFFYQAGAHLFELRKDINKFLEIQKNKDEYLEEEFQEINFMHNSIKIFQEKIEADDFEDLVYCFLQHSKSDYKRLHGYMKKAGINYLDKSEDGKMFYPVITDIFIDYWRIKSNYNEFSDEIKKYTNDYYLFRKRLSKGRLNVTENSLLVIKHFKLNRKDHIQNFLLTQYHDKITDHTSLNKIFRKLLLTQRDDDFCSPKIVEKYKLKHKQSDKIFKYLSFSKFYI